MVSITTEVEVYMDDFDDADLIDELEGRGYYVSKSASDSYSLQGLYDAWVYKTDDFEDMFRKFCQNTLGKSF